MIHSLIIYHKNWILRSLHFCLLSFFFCFNSSLAQQLDMSRLSGLKPRSIGPAGMSGRVTAIDVVLRNPDVIYIGTASGGLWKSTSGGIEWKPVFDDQNVSSIGAVAVDQNNPDVIWIGTGEGNPRNSQTMGHGIYRSLDGGKNWHPRGLDNSRTIHRLIIHPTNPDVVYAGVTGSAWGESTERGVFKTTNGGKSWKKILYINERTGCADLVMDPVNPNKIIVALWEYRRWPWFFKSGGKGSGLYITYDGGETWNQRTAEDGLPGGELGRIGVAISRSHPHIIYALIEAKKNALYRSTDGGFKWVKITDKNIGGRPFYYAEIYVDPQNENRLYNLHTIVTVSEDGGKTFETLIPYRTVHPDHHAWWIHPDDPDFLIDGNDGGMAISRDRGKTWRFIENLPLAQFYHITVDMDFPYNIYGGMQDNGSWRGPAYVWRQGGIRNSYWEEVAFGDGFDVVPDRSDSRYGYAMSQGGYLYRYDLHTGIQKFIRPVHPEDVPLRFNWNAAIAHDPFINTTIYYGSQFVHRSKDRGETWEIISPDLTTNDPEKQKQRESGGLTYDVTAAENFTTIICIAPSTVRQGTLWVGTDDGKVHLTTDSGKNWIDLTMNIKGIPAGSWVTQIQASTYRAEEAFVVFDNHRRDDWNPYVFHTRDAGKTWKNILENKNIWGYALAIVQDPVEPRLLFLGTEFGLYMSINGGENWIKWTQGYPSVSTMDLVIHPREHDLVIGTFGRAAYVFDDIRPLRILAQKGTELLDQPLVVFPVPDAYQVVYKTAPGIHFPAEAEFSGENRPYGALISFVFNPDTVIKKIQRSIDDKKSGGISDAPSGTDSITIEIKDEKYQVVRSFKREAKAGINRINWELERDGVRRPNVPKPKPGTLAPEGPGVLPGKYMICIKSAFKSDSTWVQVKADPRLTLKTEDLLAREEVIQKWTELVTTATREVDRLRQMDKTITSIQEIVENKTDKKFQDLVSLGKSLQDSVKILTELINQREVQGIRGDQTLVGARLNLVYSYLRSSFERPAPDVLTSLVQAENALKNAMVKSNHFFNTNWISYRRIVEETGISWFDCE